MAADLSDRANAGRVGLSEITLGVLPGTGGTRRLAYVGESRALPGIAKRTDDDDLGLAA